MDDDFPSVKRSPALQDALRRLGNPYASLQVEEVPAEFSVPTVEQREYARRLCNQYALLSVTVRDGKAPPSVLSPRTAPSVPEISKIGFEKECRRVFRQYIPALEKGRIRAHHRDFISRNADRAPGIRYALLDKLRRYDLRDIQGLQAHFNRERDPFTEAKLREIEVSVSGKKN